MFQILFGNNIILLIRKVLMRTYHKFKILNHQRGFIFLEILIAITLISIVFITLLGLVFSALNISSSIRKTTEINVLMKEELEAVRSFRDGTTWSNFSTVNFGIGNPYYFILSGGQWTRSSGTETIGSFTRNVFFDKVSRDPTTKYIENVYNSSNDDPDTRKVTVNVVWNSKTYQIATYLTNWQNK